MSDDLLGEDVERVAQVAGRLDLAVDHAARDDRRFEQVASVLGEDRPARRLSHLVAGSADALQPSADSAGRLDLDHEVDRTHVDAQLQRGCRDDRAEIAALEAVLDDDTLLAGE